jgi:pimeloyl-ACP methyl ester carboxylesterase
MAALSRPELFRALVLIEPVFLSPDILEAVDKLVKSGKGDDLPLVKVARMRKREWSSRREAFSHFRPKRVFSGWSDKSLHDYVTYGLRENEAGDLTLIYPPEWEARIYATVPTDVWELIPQITQPTLAIRGGKSDTMSDTAWELWQRRQPGATFVEMANSGHLLPMEEPQAVADKIKDFLDSQLID